MAFFPDSVMPSRLKDESQDVKGNKYIVCAVDVNKHDEEIRAIERVIGIRRPRFPASGFSGTVSDDGDGNFSFTASCAEEDKVDGLCPGESPPACTDRLKDVFQALEEISDRLSQIRDDYMLMTSGIVMVTDPSEPGADGKIVWPTDWPITTLSSAISDTSVDEEETLPMLDEVQLASVSGLPLEGGFITIINDASTILMTSANRNLRIIGFTSLASATDPIYAQEDIQLEDTVGNKQRIFGLGTNVEILEYEQLDTVNNKLLNVRRKQLGTSSTRHASGDLVFKGRVSISVSPINYRYRPTESRMRIDQIDCVLRSDGSIRLNVRKRDLGSLDVDDDRTTIAYAHYHAVLLRELEPLPPFEPGNNFGACQEIL